MNVTLHKYIYGRLSGYETFNFPLFWPKMKKREINQIFVISPIALQRIPENRD